jgi:serine/threonine protein phosphatase PrpC
MSASTFFLQAYGHSDKGLFRKNNEDYFKICQNVFLVADGLGGHNAGEVASKLAVESIAEKIQSLDLFDEDKQKHFEAIRHIVKQTSSEIHEISVQNPLQKGMGSTIASLIVKDDKFIAFHVGDSRIYQLRNGRLNLLTIDHANEVSVDEDQLGEIRRRYLTQAIGTTVNCEARIFSENIVNGDRYILCSDGLTDYVTTKEIELLLIKNKEPQEAALALINAALSRGGRDNITTIVLDIISKQHGLSVDLKNENNLV